MTAPRDVARIAASLSETMWHVVNRCSLAETWERDGRTFSRQWPDLVAGRSNCTMATIRALVDRGLLYEDDIGYGLTDTGLRVWISRPRQHLQQEQGRG